MQKKSQDFSMQEAMHLADSPQGRQLMELLRQTDSDAIRQATDAANAGDYTKAAQAIEKLLTPQVKELIGRLGGNSHG